MNLFTRARDFAGDVAREAGEAVGNVADAMRPQRPTSIAQIARNFVPGAALGMPMARRAPMLPMNAQPRQPINPNRLQVTNERGGLGSHMLGMYEPPVQGSSPILQTPEDSGAFYQPASFNNNGFPLTPLQGSETRMAQPAAGFGALDYNGRIRVR